MLPSPTTLEAVTCILAEYSRSRSRLFSDEPWTYIRCQENVQGCQVVVGGFGPSGLIVYYDDDYDVFVGVAGCWKF